MAALSTLNSIISYNQWCNDTKLITLTGVLGTIRCSEEESDTLNERQTLYLHQYSLVLNFRQVSLHHYLLRGETCVMTDTKLNRSSGAIVT